MKFLNKLSPIKRYLSNVEDRYNIQDNKGEYQGYPIFFVSYLAAIRGDVGGAQILIVSARLQGETSFKSCVIGKKSWLNALYTNSREYLGDRNRDLISQEEMFIGKLRILTDPGNQSFYSEVLTPFYDRLESVCSKGILTPPFFFLYGKELWYVKTVGMKINEEEVHEAISLMVDLAKYIDGVS